MSRFTQVPPFLHTPLAQRPERVFSSQCSPGGRQQRGEEVTEVARKEQAGRGRGTQAQNPPLKGRSQRWPWERPWGTGPSAPRESAAPAGVGFSLDGNTQRRGDPELAAPSEHPLGGVLNTAIR